MYSGTYSGSLVDYFDGAEGCYPHRAFHLQGFSAIMHSILLSWVVSTSVCMYVGTSPGKYYAVRQYGTAWRGPHLPLSPCLPVMPLYVDLR